MRRLHTGHSLNAMVYGRCGGEKRRVQDESESDRVADSVIVVDGIDGTSVGYAKQGTVSE